MNLGTVYAKNPDYVQRDVAGECILVPIRRNLTESNSIMPSFTLDDLVDAYTQVGTRTG